MNPLIFGPHLTLALKFNFHSLMCLQNPGNYTSFRVMCLSFHLKDFIFTNGNPVLHCAGALTFPQYFLNSIFLSVDFYILFLLFRTIEELVLLGVKPLNPFINTTPVMFALYQLCTLTNFFQILFDSSMQRKERKRAGFLVGSSTFCNVSSNRSRSFNRVYSTIEIGTARLHFIVF